MRVQNGLALLVLLTVGSVAFGEFGLRLQGPNGESQIGVPRTGGTYDVAVVLTRTPGETRAISGAQFQVTAASTRGTAANLRGVVGSTGLAATGTRYNSNEWDADVTNGMALDPNLAARTLSAVPTSPLGSGHLGLWTANTSLLGYLSINFGAFSPNDRVVITPVSATFFPDFIQSFDDISATGTAITFTPEPAVLALLAVGGMFLARRSPRRALP